MKLFFDLLTETEKCPRYFCWGNKLSQTHPNLTQTLYNPITVKHTGKKKTCIGAYKLPKKSQTLHWNKKKTLKVWIYFQVYVTVVSYHTWKELEKIHSTWNIYAARDFSNTIRWLSILINMKYSICMTYSSGYPVYHALLHCSQDSRCQLCTENQWQVRNFRLSRHHF